MKNKIKNDEVITMDNSQCATKSDLETVRTELKSDIKALRTELKLEIKALRQQILRLEERVEKLEEDIKNINQIMNIKLDRLQNTLDAFVGAIDDLRTDNTVGAHHTRELQKRVADHEERLKQIESAKHAV